MNIVSCKDEIDARHAASKAAQERRDAETYLEQLDPEVVVIEPDGRECGFADLARGVRWQFENFDTFSSSFERESFEETPTGAVEVARQRVRAEIKAFFVVRRVFECDRRSRLQWTRCTDGQLRITRLEMLEQDMRTRFRLGWR